jgi:hypothetical protein
MQAYPNSQIKRENKPKIWKRTLGRHFKNHLARAEYIITAFSNSSFTEDFGNNWKKISV